MLAQLEELANRYRVTPGLVLHAGASSCQERDIYKAAGFEPVVWIEALPWVAVEAEKTLMEYPNQEVLCRTLWGVSGELKKFYPSNNEGHSSSLLRFGDHRKIHPKIEQLPPIETRTTKLDDLIEKIGLNSERRISLLVLDLQGVEFEVLNGAKKILEITDSIVIEVSLKKLYKNQHTFSEIDALLTGFNFKLAYHDLFEEGVMGDALYLSNQIPSASEIISPVIPDSQGRLKQTISMRLKYFLALIKRYLQLAS
jgi:FkbM family methyltransferase